MISIMAQAGAFWATIWICCAYSHRALAVVDDDNVPITSVQSVAGMLTNLPCNITPSIPGDRVNLVLWYKDGLGKPLYSFDLRGDITDSDGKIWAGEELGSSPSHDAGDYRAQLHTKSAPTAVLSLLGVTENDAGSFKCRVDFKRSPTRYWRVNLSVIVPPTSSVVLDEKGSPVQGVIGPFNELSTLILTCDILGGWPSSRVTWWKNGELIDDIYEEIAPGKSRNTMKVETLRREDNGAEFTCLGNNNNDTQPISNTVSLELNLRPLKTSLLWNGDPMTAEHEYEIQCQSVGAQPSAIVSWWINGDIRLKNYRNEMSENGNITQSTLKFRPSMQDHGQILSCRAENPVLPNSVKDDSQKLEIYYPPVVSLRLGSNLDETDIKEGDDVYFECHIQANPKAHKVTWMKDAEILNPDTRRGIIINQHSLVIQRVDRVSAGKYVCQATNSAGSGSSDQVQLNVKYIPVCGRPPKGVGVGKNEEARVVCHVDANPPPTDFYWQFNTTTEVNDLPDDNILIDNSISIATYIPKSEMDYGTLMCWGRNELGRQRRPCLFHVIPAGKPDRVKDCAVTNKTFTSIFIECKPGYNGGLQQTFIIEVFSASVIDASTLSLDTGQTTSSGLTSPITRAENIHFPQFSVEGLSPGTGFGMFVYAQNSKGDSEKEVLRAFTLKSAERQVDQPEAKLGTEHQHRQRRVIPVIWIVVAIASLLVLVIILLGLVIRTRCFTHNGSGRNRGSSRSGSNRSGSLVLQECQKSQGGKGNKKKGPKGGSKNGTMKFPHHHHQHNSGEMEIGRHADSTLASGESVKMPLSVSFRSVPSHASEGSSTLLSPLLNHTNVPHLHAHTHHLMSPLDLTSGAPSAKYLTNPRRSVCLEDPLLGQGMGPRARGPTSHLHYTTLPRNMLSHQHLHNHQLHQGQGQPLHYPQPSRMAPINPPRSPPALRAGSNTGNGNASAGQEPEITYAELSLPPPTTGLSYPHPGMAPFTAGQLTTTFRPVAACGGPHAGGAMPPPEEPTVYGSIDPGACTNQGRESVATPPVPAQFADPPASVGSSHTTAMGHEGRPGGGPLSLPLNSSSTNLTRF